MTYQNYCDTIYCFVDILTGHHRKSFLTSQFLLFLFCIPTGFVLKSKVHPAMYVHISFRIKHGTLAIRFPSCIQTKKNVKSEEGVWEGINVSPANDTRQLETG